MEHSVPLRVAGALTGEVYVSSLDASVLDLRTEIARLLGMREASHVKIIAGGRNLQDDAKPLRAYNVTPTSRLLVTRGADQGQAVSREAERTARLDTLRKAVDKLSSRDGRGLTEHRELSLENQDGTRMHLKPEDQKALIMGMLMHDKGRHAMRSAPPGGVTHLAALSAAAASTGPAAPASTSSRDDGASTSAGASTSGGGGGQRAEAEKEARHVAAWSAALDVLLMAEEGFALVGDAALLAAVDNRAMLLIDIVWCCYQLGDVRRLAVCRDRLQSARAALQRAHGAKLERLRTLHGGFSPEMATYVRLEVLEGVVAYHLRETAAASASLRSALTKWRALQVEDQPLVSLQEMGYGLRESTRALRFTSGGGVEGAVTFINEQRRRKEEREERRKRLSAWNAERVQYGKTATGKYVDVEAFDALVAMGYDRGCAAEALRACENLGTPALELLLDDTRRAGLALTLVARSMQKALPAPPSTSATAAAAAAAAARAAATAARSAAEGVAADGGDAAAAAVAGGAASGGVGAPVGGAAAAAAGEAGAEEETEEEEDEEEEEEDSGVAEAEADLMRTVESDPMAAYDIDVAQEGEILETYLALLDTAGHGGQGGGVAPMAE